VQGLYGSDAASDTVRAYCEARLRSAVANGTISWEDFERRLDATYAVGTLAELDELVRSLPEPHDLPAKTVAPRRRNRIGVAAIAVALCAAMILILFIVRSPARRPRPLRCVARPHRLAPQRGNRQRSEHGQYRPRQHVRASRTHERPPATALSAGHISLCPRVIR
jgi:hypothetical protein